MAVTPLTAYGWAIQPTGLRNAAALTPNAGSPSTFTYPTSLVGQATGYGQVCGAGQTAAWPAANSLQDANGLGFLMDAISPRNLLDLMEIVPGTWTPEVSLATSVGGTTLVADVITRVFIWRASSQTFELFGTFTLPGQTITSSSTTFMLPQATLPAMQFEVGDRLYTDVWLNVTTNTNGNSNLAVNIALVTNGFYGNASTSWITPGYQPLTPTQLAGNYEYGGFPLNDGVYSVQTKEFPFPDVTPALYKIARLEGMKKTGETVSEVKLPVTIRVIGTSRADLEEKIDALYAALALRQQPLTLHSTDGRYWVCDAIAGKAAFAPGKLISVEVPVTFLAAQPYAYAAVQSTFSSGTQSPVGSNGVYTFSTYLEGGGTIAARPALVITNLAAGDNCTLNTALTNGSPYTSIQVASLANPLAAGDTLLLTSGANTQSVVVSAAAAASGSPVTISVNSFNANFSYPASTTTVVKQEQITQVVITQVQDGQTLTISGLIMHATGYLTIVCDPTAANGYTVIQNNNGVPLAFSGTFPVLEPGQTQWNVAVSCPSNAVFSVVWTWTPRFLG